MSDIESEAILNFWFSEEVKPYHFQKTPEFDQQLRVHFMGAYEEAIQGSLDDWAESARACLALVFIFDQFPRNMFRDTPRAFASDTRACQLTKHAGEKGFDAALLAEERGFLYMPLMHSETLAHQALCVALHKQLGLAENLEYAVAHRDIIKRFGRFPHRNTLLQRASTSEEIKQPASSF